tara:strand:- start:132 stop:401 length:270 start_codon:yes stop_codon:yes gene_type:complete
MVLEVMGVLVLQTVSQVPQSLMPEVVEAVQATIQPVLVLEALVVLAVAEMALPVRLLLLKMEQQIQAVAVAEQVLTLAHMPMVVMVVLV